jgi:methyl-accepting chemotaxis protein
MTLERFTLRARILSIVLLAILILLGTSGFQYIRFNTIEDLVDKMYRHPVTVSSVVKSIDYNIVLIHREMKDIALGKNITEAKAIVDRLHDETLSRFELLEERFLGDKRQITELRQWFIDWELIRQKVIDFKNEGNTEAAANITRTEGVVHIKKLTDRITYIQSFADDKLQTFYGGVKDKVRSASLVVIAIALLSALAFIITSFSIIRSIVKPLNKLSSFSKQIAEGNLTANITASNNNEIDSLGQQMLFMRDNLKGLISRIGDIVEPVEGSSHELQRMVEHFGYSTKQQTSGLEQVSSAIDEMAATVGEVAQNAQLALEAATQTFDNATDGSNATAQVTTQASELVANTTEVQATLQQLESETKNVESVLDMIREISEQTNLLALNAAIEAARAGEHGRGFAVVADEVRNLAAKTQSSVEDIQKTITELQSGSINAVKKMGLNFEMSEETSKLAGLTNDSLERIMSSANQIQDMNTQIATASEQQSIVSNEISKNVTDVYTSSKEVISEIEKVEIAAKKLSVMSGQLKSEVGKFRLH